MSRFFKITGNLLFVIVILLAILLAGVRIVGLTPYAVLSGSMEPAYHVGSLIYVKDVDVEDIRKGDPITFAINDSTLVTHRVVKVIEKDGNLMFRTKGDANDYADANLVDSRNVTGCPVFTIPYLGYLSAWIQNPPGRYIAIGLLVLAIFMAFVPDILRHGRSKEEKNT